MPTGPEQPIDTASPGNSFPAGNVVTFLDRHRRTVFLAVTELRRATKASSPTARPADGACVSCAGRRLIKAGPTGGATMQQVELSIGFVLRATCSESGTRSRTMSHTRSSGPATDTTPCDRPDGHRHGQTTVRGPAPLPAGGRLFRPTHPPLLTTRPRELRTTRGENTSAPATLLRPETIDPRKIAPWAWSKAETERRRHAAATQPTLARSTPSPTCNPRPTTYRIGVNGQLVACLGGFPTKSAAVAAARRWVAEHIIDRGTRLVVKGAA